MRHPFQSISVDRIPRYLIPLILLTLLTMFTLNGLGSSLNNATAPNGIITFELAGDVDAARNIIGSWDQPSQLMASFNLGLDFLFLVIYSNAIGMGCLWAMSAFIKRPSILLSVGIYLAWGQWLAALFDAIENAALLTLLLGSIQTPYPQVARIFAVMKFTLIAFGLTYVVLGALVKVINRLKI